MKDTPLPTEKIRFKITAVQDGSTGYWEFIPCGKGLEEWCYLVFLNEDGEARDFTTIKLSRFKKLITRASADDRVILERCSA